MFIRYNTEERNQDLAALAQLRTDLVENDTYQLHLNEEAKHDVLIAIDTLIGILNNLEKLNQDIVKRWQGGHETIRYPDHTNHKTALVHLHHFDNLQIGTFYWVPKQILLSEKQSAEKHSFFIYETGDLAYTNEEGLHREIKATNASTQQKFKETIASLASKLKYPKNLTLLQNLFRMISKEDGGFAEFYKFINEVRQYNPTATAEVEQKTNGLGIRACIDTLVKPYIKYVSQLKNNKQQLLEFCNHQISNDGACIDARVMKAYDYAETIQKEKPRFSQLINDSLAKIAPQHKGNYFWTVAAIFNHALGKAFSHDNDFMKLATESTPFQDTQEEKSDNEKRYTLNSDCFPIIKKYLATAGIEPEDHFVTAYESVDSHLKDLFVRYLAFYEGEYIFTLPLSADEQKKFDEIMKKHIPSIETVTINNTTDLNNIQQFIRKITFTVLCEIIDIEFLFKIKLSHEMGIKLLQAIQEKSISIKIIFKKNRTVLHFAAIANNLDLLNLGIEQVDTATVDANSDTALNYAGYNNHWSLAERLYHLNSSSKNTARSILLYAFQHNQTALPWVQKIIRQTTQINHLVSTGYHAFHFTLIHFNADICRAACTLLDAEIDPTFHSASKPSPYFLAASTTSIKPEALRWLLNQANEHSIDLDINQLLLGKRALEVAVLNKDIEKIVILLEQPNIRIEEAYKLALNLQLSEIITLLHQYKAINILLQDFGAAQHNEETSGTALTIFRDNLAPKYHILFNHLVFFHFAKVATERSLTNLLNYIVENCPHVRTLRTSDGNTLLHYAVAFNRIQLAKKLLTEEATRQILALNYAKASPLNLSLDKQNFMDLFESHLKAETDPKLKERINSHFVLAAKQSHWPLVHYLLKISGTTPPENTNEPNVLDYFLLSEAPIATFNEDAELFKKFNWKNSIALETLQNMLASKSWDRITLLIQTSHQQSLFCSTTLGPAIHHQTILIDELFRLESNPTPVFDQFNTTALHDALAQNNIAVAEKLCRLGWSINLCNDAFYTPLHAAAGTATLETLRWILSQPHIDINKKSKIFSSGLSLSICKDNKPFFSELINHPDVDIENQLMISETESVLNRHPKYLTLLESADYLKIRIINALRFKHFDAVCSLLLKLQAKITSDELSKFFKECTLLSNPETTNAAESKSDHTGIVDPFKNTIKKLLLTAILVLSLPDFKKFLSISFIAKGVYENSKILLKAKETDALWTMTLLSQPYINNKVLTSEDASTTLLIQFHQLIEQLILQRAIQFNDTKKFAAISPDYRSSIIEGFKTIYGVQTVRAKCVIKCLLANDIHEIKSYLYAIDFSRKAELEQHIFTCAQLLYALPHFKNDLKVIYNKILKHNALGLEMLAMLGIDLAPSNSSPAFFSTAPKTKPSGQIAQPASKYNPMSGL